MFCNNIFGPCLSFVDLTAHLYLLLIMSPLNNLNWVGLYIVKLLWNLHLLIFSAHSCNVYSLLYMIPSGLSVRGSNHVFTVKRVNIGCSGYLYLVSTIELGNFNNKITKLAIKLCTWVECVRWIMLVCRTQMVSLIFWSKSERKLSEFAPLNKFNKVGMRDFCSIFFLDNFLFWHKDIRKHIL